MEGTRCAAGLAYYLKEKIPNTVIEDRRPEPLPPTALRELPEFEGLRGYQTEALEAAVAAEHGVIHQPTGAGKTVQMFAVARAVGRAGLVLVHRKDLLAQTYRRFREYAGPGADLVGLCGDGVWNPSLLTVATFQTIASKLRKGDALVKRWLKEEIGQVHVDECHHVSAKTYSQVMGLLWNARWRYGYSATPHKEGDEESFFKTTSWFGPTVHRLTTEELIAREGAVPAWVYMINMENKRPKVETYAEEVQEGIIDNRVRNDRIVKLATHFSNNSDAPILILVERIEHGERLAQRLACPFVSGSTSSKDRERTWQAVRDGEQQVLVASKIADEGLDLPNLAWLVLAGGGKAAHVTVQRIGRGMRPSEGKSEVFCFDFLDQGKWLQKQAKERLKTYRAQPAWTVEVVDFEEVLDG